MSLYFSTATLREKKLSTVSNFTQKTGKLANMLRVQELLFQ